MIFVMSEMTMFFERKHPVCKDIPYIRNGTVTGEAALAESFRRLLSIGVITCNMLADEL